MLKFVLEKETNSNVVYKYYPEGKDDVGIVSYDKVNRECKIVILATQDIHKRYAFKMFSRIRKCAENGFFEKEGTIAWY